MLSETYYINLKYLALVLSIVLLLNNSSFQLPLSSIFYVIIVLIFFVFFVVDTFGAKRYNFNAILWVIVCFVSIISNDIPSYYKVEERFTVFVCYVLLLGPLVTSKALSFFRVRLFSYINIINIPICVLSYLGLATGLYVVYTKDLMGADRVDFCGLFIHSMLLSLMSCIAILSCCYYFFNTSDKKIKALTLLCIPFCFLAAVTAGSRAALIGVAIAILFFFFKLYQENLILFLRLVVLVILIGFATYPLWKERTAMITNKMEYSEKKGSLAASRDEKWASRMKEFKYSPIVGVGFTAQKDEFAKDDVDAKEGRIEPGSSWLAIMSMTGILGLVFSALLFLDGFIFLYRDKQNRLQSAYLGSLFILFILHMFAEGYIYSFGGIAFFYIWLLLGVIETAKLKARYPIFLESNHLSIEHI